MIAGVALAVPSLWLITGGRGVSGLRKSGASWGVVYGLGAGMGFAIQLHGLGQVEDAMALYATAIGMMIGSCFLIPFAKIKERAGVRFVVPFLAGGISVTGLALYVLSRQGQAVFASIIIVSLYPLVPVCLGAYVKNEKIEIKRKLGIFLSLLTTSLIALGNEV
nr:EamA family transporter [Halomonas desiderata]